jgi:hypothetical protein
VITLTVGAASPGTTDCEINGTRAYCHWSESQVGEISKLDKFCSPGVVSGQRELELETIEKNKPLVDNI